MKLKQICEIFTDLEDDLVLEDQILPPSNNSENKENQEEEINSTEKIETLIVIENTETPETVPPEPEIITTEELIEILQDESKDNQPCKDVSSEDQQENDIGKMSSSTKNENIIVDSVLPPQPPKRSSETNKRLKNLDLKIPICITDNSIRTLPIYFSTG